MPKIKTLWGEKEQKDLVDDYNYLYYFYTWIDRCLRDCVDTNPDEKLIKERCIEIFEKQYAGQQNNAIGTLKVSANLKKSATYHQVNCNMSEEQKINFKATFIALVIFLFVPLSLWNLSWLEGFLWSVLLADFNGLVLLARIKLDL